MKAGEAYFSRLCIFCVSTDVLYRYGQSKEMSLLSFFFFFLGSLYSCLDRQLFVIPVNKKEINKSRLADKC